MANKTITDYAAAVSIDVSNDYLLLEQSSTYKKINRTVLLGLSSAPLGLTDSQSPTNKVFDNTNTLTIKAANLTIQDGSDVTKQAKFVASGITAGQTRTFTLPDASGTLATIAGTQTLTNKTITSPTITGGTIDNSTVTVDSISGHTVATTVTVANLQIANGVLNSANAVTATSMAAGAVQPQALVSGTGSGWSWTTYVPVWTNVVVGNGTSSCKYIQTGKTVIVKIQLVLGNTSSVSGVPVATLPVTANSSYTLDSSPFGIATILDSGTTIYDALPLWGSSTTIGLYAKDASASAVKYLAPTANVPMTWGAGDAINALLIYETT